MDYRIVADSSCDINEAIEQEFNVDLVPFNITIEGIDYRDDKDLDVMEMVKAMKASPNPIKTSCPSPGDFLEHYRKADNIFVVTISSKLSGTYNSAILAKDIIQEEDPDKFIHVFDSKSASVGETLTLLKIGELAKKGLKNTEIVEQVEDYIANMTTFFLSDSLDNLIKNGRISKTKGLIANVLNLKPIMGEDDGDIVLVENIRGSKRSFNRLIDIIIESKEDFSDIVMAISHSDNPEKAESLKEKLLERKTFKDILIVETRGLTTGYVNHKGIILSY